MRGEYRVAREIAETLLREAEADAGGWVAAAARRMLGLILFRRNPFDPAPAEEAFKATIAVARTQHARGYELLASLSLAKLYRSTNRPADAHTALAAALNAFAPTTEMPETAEAQELMERLA